MKLLKRIKKNKVEDCLISCRKKIHQLEIKLAHGLMEIEDKETLLSSDLEEIIIHLSLLRQLKVQLETILYNNNFEISPTVYNQIQELKKGEKNV